MRKVLVLLLSLCTILMIYRLSRFVLPMFDGDMSSVVAQGTPDATATDTQLPQQSISATPTVAPLFRIDNQATVDDQATIAGAMTADAMAAQNVSATDSTTTEIVPPAATETLSATVHFAEAQFEQNRYREVLIYDDELDVNWSFANSQGVQYRPWDTSHWFQKLDTTGLLSSGATAVAVDPQQEYGTFLLSVRNDATVQYRRDEILGISFWLNSGDTLIEPDDLTVSIVGDDGQPYWRETGRTANTAPFSETRLYYLGINRSIPPHTWVNIVVWLDKLIYDPNYTYLTGFYIKNDADMRNTYYVDYVSLLMTNEAQ